MTQRNKARIRGSCATMRSCRTRGRPTKFRQWTLMEWLRPDYGIVIDGSGFVNTWVDASGKNYNPTQATTANRPQFSGSVLAGIPGVKFDGVNDTLEFTYPVAVLSNRTRFIVGAWLGGTAPVDTLMDGTPGSFNTMRIARISTTVLQMNPAAVQTVPGVTTTNWQLYHAATDGISGSTRTSIQANTTGGTFGGAPSATVTVGGIVLGAAGAAFSYGNVAIAEEVTYGTLMINSVRYRVANYFRTKYRTARLG